MSSQSKQPASSKAPIADNVSQPPLETKELRRGLKALMGQTMVDPITNKSKRIGSYQFGVYAFYDYDGEPIYVGQTRERLSGRVSRHLTNQRTDAAAMSVLDPFEVCEVELWPVPNFEGRNPKDLEVRTYLNALERTVYDTVLEDSTFGAVLNEKLPPETNPVKLPPSFRGRIVSDEIMELRSHPDVRLSRRAATIARLAQIISERQVKPG